MRCIIYKIIEEIYTVTFLRCGNFIRLMQRQRRYIKKIWMGCAKQLSLPETLYFHYKIYFYKERFSITSHKVQRYAQKTHSPLINLPIKTGPSCKLILNRSQMTGFHEDRPKNLHFAFLHSTPPFNLKKHSRIYKINPREWISLVRIYVEEVCDDATAWFPPPTLNPHQPPLGRRIDYKMARRRECGRPDLSRLL